MKTKKKVLNATTVKGKLPTGKHAAGVPGLFLEVGEEKRNWRYRYMLDYKRREMGLGTFPEVSLEDARSAANRAREMVKAGVDPLGVKADRKEAARKETAPTVVHLWGPRRDAYVDSIAPSFKLNARKLAKGETVSALEKLWRSRLHMYGPSADTDIGAIDTAFVVKLLGELWQKKNCTAERVRGYCERVWDSAKVLKQVEGDNPFRFEGNLQALGWKKTFRKKTKGFKAASYAELPEVMRKLQARDDDTARAVAFTIYTACRTNETAFAEPADFAGDRWNRPKEKMKMGAEHTVPLTKEARALVPKVKAGFVFCPQTSGIPMHENKLLNRVNKMGYKFTTHGFRSAFTTWALNEVRGVEQWLVDFCTAHAIGGTTKHYHREEALAKARELFEVWACYLNGGQWRQLRAQQLMADLAADVKEAA